MRMRGEPQCRRGLVWLLHLSWRGMVAASGLVAVWFDCLLLGMSFWRSEALYVVGADVSQEILDAWLSVAHDKMVQRSSSWKPSVLLCGDVSERMPLESKDVAVAEKGFIFERILLRPCRAYNSSLLQRATSNPIS